MDCPTCWYVCCDPWAYIYHVRAYVCCVYVRVRVHVVRARGACTCVQKQMPANPCLAYVCDVPAVFFKKMKATRGDMIWKRGVGMSACELIFKYIARSVNATLDGSDADGSSSDASKKKKKSTVANKKVLCIAAKTDARIESLNSDTPVAEKVAGHTDTTLYTNCSDVAHSEDRATVGVDEIEAETLAAIQTIVDPFCGHGSFLAMASRYGFDSIGVERTKKRAKTAAHALFL